jgi:pimeloyl-ACP methyl ester carboxylesterase
MRILGRHVPSVATAAGFPRPPRAPRVPTTSGTACDARNGGALDSTGVERSPSAMSRLLSARRAGLVAAVTTLPFALAYRFALIYRVRAGYPHQNPPVWTPDVLGLPYEQVLVPSSAGSDLPGWFIPAGPDPAPGVVLVHGWESARDRTLPHAQVLHAAGFHVLTLDVRGHGANPPESLPLSVGEYAADARAGVAALRARPEVTRIALLGHSMGAAGSIVAAAGNPDVAAVIALATPADPYRLTRQTFRLARLPIPGLVAWPLAWLTTRVYLGPRRHSVASISASRAIRHVEAPVLLVHGSDDVVLPVAHLDRLARTRRTARPDLITETLVIPGGEHSWQYESPTYRAGIARFLATNLGGPLSPPEAAARAWAVDARRLPEPERLTALDREPGGFRSLTGIARRVPSPAGPDTVTRPGQVP